MKTAPIYSVFNFTLIIVIQIFIVLIIPLFTESSSSCIRSTNQIASEEKRTFFVYATVMIIELYFIFKKFKELSSFNRVSIWLIPIIILPLLCVKARAFDVNNYHQSLNKKEWISAKEKPVPMIRKLIYDKALIGKSREEVFEILGETDDQQDPQENSIEYRTEFEYSTFVVSLRNDTVIETYINCYD